jgi:hypothetical protein
VFQGPVDGRFLVSLVFFSFLFLCNFQLLLMFVCVVFPVFI